MKCFSQDRPRRRPRPLRAAFISPSLHFQVLFKKKETKKAKRPVHPQKKEERNKNDRKKSRFSIHTIINLHPAEQQERKRTDAHQLGTKAPLTFELISIKSHRLLWLYEICQCKYIKTVISLCSSRLCCFLMRNYQCTFPYLEADL